MTFEEYVNSQIHRIKDKSALDAYLIGAFIGRSYLQNRLNEEISKREFWEKEALDDIRLLSKRNGVGVYK